MRRDIVRRPTVALDYNKENKEIAVHNELLIDEENMMWIKRHDEKTGKDVFLPLWKIALDMLKDNSIRLLGTVDSYEELADIDSPTVGDIYLVKVDENSKDNVFQEYIYVKNGDRYQWEKLGSNTSFMIDVRADDPKNPPLGYCWINTNNVIDDPDDPGTDIDNDSEFGLLGADGTCYVPWVDLVQNYGLSVTKDYTEDTYKTDTTSPYYVLSKLSFVYPNATVLKIPPAIQSLGEFAFYGIDTIESVEGYDSNSGTTEDVPDVSDTLGITSDETRTGDITINPELSDDYEWTITKNGGTPTTISTSPYTISGDGEYVIKCRNKVYGKESSVSFTIDSTAPGLHKSDGTVISWDELTNTYGLDIEKDYTEETCLTDSSSAYSVFKAHPELTEGDLYIPDSVSQIGSYAFYGCDDITEIEASD